MPSTLFCTTRRNLQEPPLGKKYNKGTVTCIETFQFNYPTWLWTCYVSNNNSYSISRHYHSNANTYDRNTDGNKGINRTVYTVQAIKAPISAAFGTKSRVRGILSTIRCRSGHYLYRTGTTLSTPFGKQHLRNSSESCVCLDCVSVRLV